MRHTKRGLSTGAFILPPQTQEQAKKSLGEAPTMLSVTKDDILGRGSDRLKQSVVEPGSKYYTLLDDSEAVDWILKNTKSKQDEARQIIRGFRREAHEMGKPLGMKIHAEVKPGCLFRRDIPLMGPIFKNLDFLKYWDFLDTPTNHALVSWVPAPLRNSGDKTASEQVAVIQKFKAETFLPDWYDVSFGSVNHIAGMSLAHFNTTSESPFNSLRVRTDTCDGKNAQSRLELLWSPGCLNCSNANSVRVRYPGLVVFAMGVLKAG